ncbi:MAG: VWA domain-containing protein [Roseburia sp.]|nr:VWA domain-containing protein [Roseburia sp.]
MSSINFDNPYLLFLIIPIAALFIIPFAIAVRKDNLNGHNIASGIIHIIMAVIIAFVAAGTSIVTTVTETNVYVVADVSYSANRNLDTVDGYISQLGKSLPRNSKMGVVTFGKNYQLLTPLGDSIKSVKTSLVDDSATDIISALKYTGELFREDVIKRIVVITDGKQTAETDANALKRQVDALAERNIHVDAIYLDDNIKSNAREVQISAAEVTPATFVGGSPTARLTVNCSCPETMKNADGETVAYEVSTILEVSRTEKDGGDPVVSSYNTHFTRGSNYYDLPLYSDEQGVYDYTVTVKSTKPEEDENARNNVISFTQEVAGRQSILVIYDDPAENELICNAYGDSADITSYYYGSSEILSSVEWLNQFDEIVLASVDVTKLKSPNTFLANLDTAVQMFGKSLVTFGDTNIQNYTKGELSALSKMLPVVFGKSEGDEKLYTLVIDTSRSMEQHGRLDRAKRAAIEVVGMLTDADTVSVVEFNGSPNDVEPKLVKLSEGRQRVIDQINALEVKQGTNIPAALQFALPTATAGSYAERRLLLFSDGMNFSTDTASQPIRETVAMLLDNGVATSALDVGRAGVEANAAKTALGILRDDIAGLGGGTYLDISTDNSLKEVLEKELPEDINNSDGNLSPIFINRRSDEMLKEVDTEALLSPSAFVDKFVYTTKAMGSATTVLQVEYVGTSGRSSKRPLYAYWNRGKGRVASFTAGLTNEWLAAINTDLRMQLVRGILRTNAPEQKISEPFLLDIENYDGYSEITLTPETMHLDAVTSVEITSPEGKTSAKTALANAASMYTHTFVTGDEGKYTVKITYKERETAQEYTVERAVHVAYSSEYDSFALYDAGALHKMIGAHGTVSENGRLSIVNDEKEVGLYNVSLSMPLLIACVVLYAVDIAVRKLKWEDIKSLFKRHKKVEKQ